jgi:hypothetical protein
MIVPASKMLTAWALAISMPAEPEITPKLVIPPVKVRPAISIAVLLPARISLALSIRIPWLVATIVPLSTIAQRGDRTAVGGAARKDRTTVNQNTVAGRHALPDFFAVAEAGQG